MDIKERVNLILKELKLNNAELGKKIDFSPSAIGKYRNPDKKEKPGGDFAARLQKEFNISSDWLLTGKGSMYLDEEQKDAIEILANKHGCTVEEYELIMKFLDEEKDLALYAAKAAILKDKKARERFIKLTE